MPCQLASRRRSSLRLHGSSVSCSGLHRHAVIATSRFPQPEQSRRPEHSSAAGRKTVSAGRFFDRFVAAASVQCERPPGLRTPVPSSSTIVPAPRLTEPASSHLSTPLPHPGGEHVASVQPAVASSRAGPSGASGRPLALAPAGYATGADPAPVLPPGAAARPGRLIAALARPVRLMREADRRRGNAKNRNRLPSFTQGSAAGLARQPVVQLLTLRVGQVARRRGQRVEAARLGGLRPALANVARLVQDGGQLIA